MKKKKKKLKKIKRKTFKPYPESKLFNPEKHGDSEVWGTLDGQWIPVKNLRDSHLSNIVNHFEQLLGRETPLMIKTEIERRKKIKLAKSSKIARILYDSKR